jgi:hypothetical protein
VLTISSLAVIFPCQHPVKLERRYGYPGDSSGNL